MENLVDLGWKPLGLASVLCVLVAVPLSATGMTNRHAPVPGQSDSKAPRTETCRLREPVEPPAPDGAFRPLTTSFAVKFQDEVNRYQLMSAFLQPGETLTVDPVMPGPASRFSICADSGSIQPSGGSSWVWQAPTEPGLYRLDVTEEGTGETMQLNVFVLTPYRGEESLEGFRIGAYPEKPLRNNPAYSMPQGMVRVTPEMQGVWVSPHFQLGQFLCKQEGDFPKFLVLRTRLLLKLEALLERVNAEGHEAQSFVVMSGYRTPWYNESIGNQTQYSRHAFGDAADIYLDEDGDGAMDDIDDDGDVDLEDARILYDVVEAGFEQAWYRPFIGGMGLYGPKPHRGPFVHVDARGFRARW